MAENTVTKKNRRKSDQIILESVDDSKGLIETLSNGQEKSGQLFRSSLSQVMEVLLEKSADKNFSGELLLHVPPEILTEIPPKNKVRRKLAPKGLFICRSKSGSTSVNCVNAYSIPKSDHLSDSLVVVAMSDTNSCSIIASPVKTIQRQNRDAPWDTLISFKPAVVASNCKVLRNRVKQNRSDNDDGKSVDKWLRDTESQLKRRGDTQPLDDWAEMLTELLFTVEEQKHEKDHELQWHKLMSQVQDKVGWELDPNKLFNEITQILKTTIGFDYLELQFLDDRDQELITKATSQQNYTSFGGPLLTIILKDDKRDDVLKHLTPTLLDSQSSKAVLMNPLLLQYMGLESGIIVPICHRRHVNGLLKLFAKQKHHFTEEDIPRFEVIGRIISRSIENVKAHSIMRRMATTDGLTGIYNHRFFMEQLSREFKRAVRYQAELTLIMADIDYFKHYNDTNGHLEGDYVLVDVGKLLTECIRSADIVARYGGEEFTIILPETTIEQGVVVCEKIQQVMNEHPFKYADTQPDGKLTLSLGIATVTPDIMDSTELIKRADIALYRSKKGGRNQYNVY